MNKFALITEGVTDQIVIDNILSGFFDTNDIDINSLQPPFDETDKNRLASYGGWTLVLDYCASTKFKEVFQYNEYIIIQIDTDVSEESHFDIPHRDDQGKELTVNDLIQRVRAKFRALIGENFLDNHEKRILFAISVHSVECWLLPIYYTDTRKSKIVNCLDTLNRQLQKKENFSIDRDAKNIDYYEIIAKQYRKQKTLIKLYKENPSLRIFIEEIEHRNIEITLEDDF